MLKLGDWLSQLFLVVCGMLQLNYFHNVIHSLHTCSLLMKASYDSNTSDWVIGQKEAVLNNKLFV